MVPGELTMPMPCFAAKPLRGRTCPSKPVGMATRMPVGTTAKAPGASARGSGSGGRGAKRAQLLDAAGPDVLAVVVAIREAVDSDPSPFARSMDELALADVETD